jgi:glycosyltransferase involved in cell wall biosynthesis
VADAVSRPRILVISTDSVGERMSGIGIRSTEIARALQADGDVAVAAIRDGTTPLADLETIPYELRSPGALRRHVATADVVIAQPQWPEVAHWLTGSTARVIFDLYDPEPFEVLEFLAERPRMRRLLGAYTLDRIAHAMRLGHHLICASDKQRDLWTGMLLAEHVLTPRLYDRDPTLRSVLDTVPFGMPASAAQRVGGGIRAALPSIPAEAEIVLWNGGLWQWLDAPTAIRAVARLARRRPDVRLVFMGASAQAPARAATEQARALAAELGVLDSVVHFNDAWVPYAERASWLLDADVAISTHVDHLETRFAFRTRLLDCLWARLPIVCTRGDDLAAMVERRGLGAAVPERDPDAVANALEAVLARGRDAFEHPLADAAAEFTWARVTEPLRRWITEPVLPPRIGAGSPRRPAQLARAATFRAGMRTLNALGLKWPRL